MGVSQGMSCIVASLVRMLEQLFNDHYLMFSSIRRATGDVVKFFIYMYMQFSSFLSHKQLHFRLIVRVVRCLQCYIHLPYPLYDLLGRVRETSGIMDRLLHDVVEQLIIIIAIKWRLRVQR